jgi:hypothetical protein
MAPLEDRVSEQKPPPPLCVFCNAPWTDDMVKIFAQASMYHGYYEGDIWVEGIAASLDVTCGSCGRLVYRKELSELPLGQWES